MTSLIEEAKNLVQLGVREINLVSQTQQHTVVIFQMAVIWENFYEDWQRLKIYAGFACITHTL